MPKKVAVKKKHLNLVKKHLYLSRFHTLGIFFLAISVTSAFQINFYISLIFLSILWILLNISFKWTYAHSTKTGIILLILTALVLAVGFEETAEKLATYAFFLLLAGVILSFALEREYEDL